LAQAVYFAKQLHHAKQLHLAKSWGFVHSYHQNHQFSTFSPHVALNLINFFELMSTSHHQAERFQDTAFFQISSHIKNKKKLLQSEQNLQVGKICVRRTTFASKNSCCNENGFCK
jgi:hypothetical protein